jgi:hypothetical protein
MINFPKLSKAIEHVVDRWGPIDGRTRLLKLIYLADFEWAKANGGKPYTEADYYRWNHGPFSREFLECIEWMDGIEIAENPVRWEGGTTYRYKSGPSTRLGSIAIDDNFLHLLDEIGARWRDRSLRELLDHVYQEEGFAKREFGQHLF